MKYLAYKNNDQMPILGLGTWKSEPGEVYDAVREAIKVGYRHIDCAAIYGNEKEVGEAISDVIANGEIDRKELWVTSKLWNSAHKQDDVRPALENTLRDLKLDYLDLYLMHWPIAFQPGVTFPRKGEEFLSLNEVPLKETWKEMEKAKVEGLVRHIGVSNFNIDKLEQISDGAEIKPEMNQVELHPFLPQEKLVNFCKKHGVLLTAYSPLGSGDRKRKGEDEPSLMNHDVIKKIADNHDATPAQVLIAWSVYRNIAVIPKSTNAKRIKQNFDAATLALESEDMDAIEAIGKSYRFIDGTIFTQKGSPYSLEDLWEE